MPDQPTSFAAIRSASSSLFEKTVRAAAGPAMIPNLSDIDFKELWAFAPWIAIIDPDNKERTLRFSLAGAELSKFMGRDLIGFDYLDIVDPAIKGDAFDSVFLMLSRPCGLWQVTPALTTNGETIVLEYTGLPVFDRFANVGKIIFLIQHDHAGRAEVPRLAAIQRSQEWHWLEMRDTARA